MMTEQATATKAYCNVLAIEKGLDPAGYASDFETLIVAEIPLPWKKNIYKKAGALPQETIDLMEVWLKRYHEGLGYHNHALMIAPDKAYSQAGCRRLMFYTRKPGAIADFDKVEYLVPENRLGPLMWALHEARDQRPSFEAYRVPEADHIRELLVCTHGTVDAACAKFGYPLYNYLRKNYASDQLRVWRVSHFGGHVFAPTMMDMPLGHYWAYVEDEQADQIVKRNGDVAALRGHYRGWAGLERSYTQVAEREIWQREGWDWFSYPKSATVLAQDEAEEPEWMEVRLEYETPKTGVCGAYEARVEIQHRIETIGTTGYERTYPYPQYVVTRLEKVE
jgi:hypothetical protein